MTEQSTNQDKLNKAIDYLRKRNIYLIDNRNNFVPTCAAGTNVKETWARYLSKTESKHMEET